MSCNPNKFTITKGLDNEFVFTVKQTGTTLPMEIVDGDTFIAKLYKLEDDSLALTKSTTITDMLSGKITLTILASETTNLISDKADKVDRYYIRPTYRLILDCDTENNGKFLAEICEVWVR